MTPAGIWALHAAIAASGGLVVFLWPRALATVKHPLFYGVTSSVELARSPGGSDEKIGATS